MGNIKILVTKINLKWETIFNSITDCWECTGEYTTTPAVTTTAPPSEINTTIIVLNDYYNENFPVRLDRDGNLSPVMRLWEYGEATGVDRSCSLVLNGNMIIAGGWNGRGLNKNLV